MLDTPSYRTDSVHMRVLSRLRKIGPFYLRLKHGTSGDPIAPRPSLTECSHEQ
jgi:hypothetical protein